ncbi:hypothetical protein [Micromonospora zamorensis]|uniref:hypothetical protein n=1 Tax=Micromonospora zamorensis TaxID=709883 RepID=UPI003CF27FFE
MIRAGIVLVILLTGFTAGGIGMLRAGEIPGLPFAVGGAVAQVSVIVIVVTVLRARAGGDGRSLLRSRLVSASHLLGGLRRALLVALVALALYALVRVVLGDRWTLLTSAFIALFFWLIYRGVGQLMRGLKEQQTS